VGKKNVGRGNTAQTKKENGKFLGGTGRRSVIKNEKRSKKKKKKKKKKKTTRVGRVPQRGRQT